MQAQVAWQPPPDVAVQLAEEGKEPGRGQQSTEVTAQAAARRRGVKRQLGDGAGRCETALPYEPTAAEEAAEQRAVLLAGGWRPAASGGT